jgi:hypothetical protein
MLSDRTGSNGWLMIIYRLPSTPSTSRVTVWKRVKELGAHLLQQSVYILPNLPQLRDPVNRLKEQIIHLGGEGKIIEVASLGEDQEKEVVAGFNKNREEEYVEVVKACNELLHEIEAESRAQDFHFADLEENEKHLERVKALCDSVTGRDYFGSALQPKAVALMRECQQRFEEFSNEVFSRDGIVAEDRRLPLEGTRRHMRRLLLPKNELAARIQELMGHLVNSTLEVDGKRVDVLAETVALDLEYSEHKTEKTLQLRIEWTSLRTAKKA